MGGDLYNTFIRDGKLFFCIGDVSGKGIPTALIMAIVQSLFRNIASRESNPAQIMEQLNEAVCHNNKANVFVTMFVGLFDDYEYQMQEITMLPGSTLFLYTDGLTEARNARGELFGRKRVMQLLADYGAMDARQLVETVIAKVQQFAEGTEKPRMGEQGAEVQSDDLTLLAITKL